MMAGAAEKGWTESELEQQYYIWLTNWIPGWRNRYSKLLRRLYETAFRVTLMMDENRVGDGLALRTRFVSEMGLGLRERDALRMIRPCSVLEVMIALLLRYLEEYQAGIAAQEGDPMSEGFGVMLDSTGLILDDDRVFDRDSNRVNLILMLLLDRAYRPDGRGGLFYIPGMLDGEDMTQIEIWRQMMMWHTYNK